MLGDIVLRRMGEQRTGLRTSTTSFPANTLHFLVSRSYPQAAELLQRFNQGLATLQASGEYQQLIEQYLQHSADGAGYDG